MRNCENCGKSIIAKNAHARYCSTRCRVAAHRKTKTRPALPTELTDNDRWVRYDQNKRPLNAINGNNASSTNQTTWSSYHEAATSLHGIGPGYVLGNGIACIDLDNVLTNGTLNEEARKYVAQYPNHYIETSPSGNGLHIWGTSPEQPGTRQTKNGVNIERYTTGRYITITGNIYQHGKLLPL